MGILLGRVGRLAIAHAKRLATSSSGGSITLEAAIVIPFILTFLLALTTFIKLSASEAGLRAAVSQTVHQLAVQAYPIRVLTDTYLDHELLAKLDEWMATYDDYRTGIESWIEEYGILMPPEVQEMLSHALTTADEVEQQITAPVRAAMRKLMIHYLPAHMDAESLEVTKVTYPIFWDDERHRYVKLTAEYEILIHLPFFTRTITLKATAAERMWTGS